MAIVLWTGRPAAMATISSDPAVSGVSDPASTTADEPLCDAQPASPAARRDLFDRRTLLLSAGMLAAVPVGGYFVWWRGKDLTDFRVEQEGWFGPDGYSGGADKAGHLVASAAAGNLMQRFYEKLGHSPSDARWLSIGVVTIGGLIVEAGDGLKFGGASPEDAALNVAGAVMGAQIAFHGREDLLGFRWGHVSEIRQPRQGPPLQNYSRKLGTFDFKFAGLKESPIGRSSARFLMVSLTYGSRGYRELPPEQRERNVGLELGLNFPEILRAIGVPERGLWLPVYEFFQFMRVPFTAIGWHYDLDHRRWHGPVSR